MRPKDLLVHLQKDDGSRLKEMANRPIHEPDMLAVNQSQLQNLSQMQNSQQNLNQTTGLINTFASAILY